MLTRQKILLNLIEESGGRLERLRLVKLAFLLSSTSPDVRMSRFYGFVPYRFGPFSFGLYHELGALERACRVHMQRGTAVTLSRSRAVPELHRDILRDVRATVQRFAPLFTSGLVDHVYTHYPWYTANAKDSSRRAMARPVAELAVYTLGYQGLPVDTFLDVLMRRGIHRVVDVRANPVSRAYGYHKTTLARLCGDLGLDYRHVPELGILSSWRARAREHGDFANLWLRYERELLPAAMSHIGAVSSWARSTPSALVCFEANHLSCHRTLLARHVAERTALRVIHLGKEA